jgi:hypothetical protein
MGMAAQPKTHCHGVTFLPNVPSSRSYQVCRTAVVERRVFEKVVTQRKSPLCEPVLFENWWLCQSANLEGLALQKLDAQ